MVLAKGKIYAFLLVLLYYTFSGYILENFASGAINSYSLLIADVLLISLGLFSVKFGKNKMFVWIFIAFLISSTITFFLNDIDIQIHLNGLREYLIVICCFLFIHRTINSKYFLYFHAKIVWFCWLFLVLQIPISLHQFIRYGAGDAVGGGFGNGGSGTLSLSIFVIIFFLNINIGLKHKESNFNFPRLLLFVPFLLPTFINETKLTFVLIIAFFLLLLKVKFSNFFKIVIISLLAFSIFSAYEYIYSNTANKNTFIKSESSYERIFSNDFLSRYLTSQDISLQKDVSRFTKIQFAYLIIYENPMNFLFGKGMGLFKGGSIMDASQFSKKFEWLLSGTRPYLFFLLIQGGLIGTLLIISMLISPLFPNVSSSPFILRRIRLFLIFLLFLILIYNSAFRTGGFTIIFCYVSLFIYNSKMILSLTTYYNTKFNSSYSDRHFQHA